MLCFHVDKTKLAMLLEKAKRTERGIQKCKDLLYPGCSPVTTNTAIQHLRIAEDNLHGVLSELKLDKLISLNNLGINKQGGRNAKRKRSS
jgi:hypothetical protein